MKKTIFKKFFEIGSWQWKLKCKVWNFYIYYTNKFVHRFNKNKFICHNRGHIKTFNNNTIHLNSSKNIYVCHECAVETHKAAHNAMAKMFSIR